MSGGRPVITVTELPEEPCGTVLSAWEERGGRRRVENLKPKRRVCQAGATAEALHPESKSGRTVITHALVSGTKKPCICYLHRFKLLADCQYWHLLLRRAVQPNRSP